MAETLSIKGLKKVYGDVVAVDRISFNVQPNEIVGLLGPNGAGKTTTINMVLGVLAPDAGTIRLGETVKLAYVDQTRDDLNPTDTVWQAISGGLDIIKVGKPELVGENW